MQAGKNLTEEKLYSIFPLLRYYTTEDEEDMDIMPGFQDPGILDR